MVLKEITRKNFIKLGGWAGLAAGLMYLIPKVISLPKMMSTGFTIFMGPIAILSFIGLYYLLTRKEITIPVVLATISAILAGTLRMAFIVVQMNNLIYIREKISAAGSPEDVQIWKNILNGVFTVQNGLNYVADFFIDWAMILFGIAMWNYSKSAKWIAVLGFVAGGSHFLLKFYTFPKPPAESGLFDVGPLIGVWALVISIWMLFNINEKSKID